jgi:hypothetical protein
MVALNNFLIKDYGKILNLSINSKDKSVGLTVDLNGEKEPLNIKISNYRVFEKNGESFIKINGIETSRDWINRVASSYLSGKEFKVPDEFVKILNMVI